MACNHPIYAIKLGQELDTPFANGKMILKIVPQRSDISSFAALEDRYGVGNVIPLPCGKCLACRTSYTKDWSVRCLLEASLYKFNYFLTLTYDDQHINYACRKDFTDFIDRLRYYCPGVRYFACCERGETTGRLHFHAILFNCDIPDLEFIGKREGNNVFDSKLIKKLWQCGLIDIGDVTMASCQYVAGYVMKKLRTHSSDEYTLMSLKPGIGAGYFEKNFQVIYETDGVYIKGKKYKAPRYFDKLLDRLHPDMFRSVKYDRINSIRQSVVADMVLHGIVRDEDLYDYREHQSVVAMKDKLKKRSAV